MKRYRGVFAVIITGLILGVLAAGAGIAADAKSTVPVFAIVDFGKAFDGYEKKKTLEGDLKLAAQQAQMKLDLRIANKLLTTEEYAQLVELKLKAKPTDVELKKIDEILNLSKQREQELLSLQQKNPPNDADKLRLAQLGDQIKKSEQEHKDVGTKYDADLTKQSMDLSAQLIQDLNVAVAAIAKEKGITVVFNKSSTDAVIVVYCSLDITDDVLKRINKK